MFLFSYCLTSVVQVGLGVSSETLKDSPRLGMNRLRISCYNRLNLFILCDIFSSLRASDVSAELVIVFPTIFYPRLNTVIYSQYIF